MSSNDGLSDVEKREALNDLLKSPGWQLLVLHTSREWGVVGYGRRMEAAIKKVLPGPDRAYDLAAEADRITHSKKAIDDLMDWPEQERLRLTPQKADRRPFSALRRTTG